MHSTERGFLAKADIEKTLIPDVNVGNQAPFPSSKQVFRKGRNVKTSLFSVDDVYKKIAVKGNIYLRAGVRTHKSASARDVTKVTRNFPQGGKLMRANKIKYRKRIYA